MKFVKPQAGAYKDKTKPADVRLSNINAAKGEFTHRWPIRRLFIRKECIKSLSIHSYYPPNLHTNPIPFPFHSNNTQFLPTHP